jgi:tetratricopeptide (TPR) repeat protein
MDCPRCGAVAGDGLECPRCGVVLAKALRAVPRGNRTPAADDPEDQQERGAAGGSRWLSTLAMAALGILAIALLVRAFREEDRPAAREPLATVTQGSSTSAAADEPSAGASDIAPPPRPAPSSPAPVDPTRLPKGSQPEDFSAVARLTDRLNGHVPISADDLRTAERLFESYPDATRGLLQATLVAIARQHRNARRYDEAERLLTRAGSLLPASNLVPREILLLRLEQQDWPGAERAANELLRRLPQDAEAVQALAFALIRQDRSREARGILEAYLIDHDDSVAKSLLERILAGDKQERGLQQQTLAHFSVRYDGNSQEDVGREVLGVLERHYATLATTFDHQPTETIPVVLLSRQAYYGSGSVPAWAGGHYDTFDGRVRIPIGGLTTSLTPQLDGTVLHELTHAFVADYSKGVAPTELQEGLAQWMEGYRTDEQAMKLLVTGRIDGVGASYLSALAFVEQLMAERGQGSINDVLAEMAKTRSADEAFRSVYGDGYYQTVAAARTRWRQLYGS